jgi:hypothetical protein
VRPHPTPPPFFGGGKYQKSQKQRKSWAWARWRWRYVLLEVLVCWMARRCIGSKCIGLSIIHF